MATVAEKASEEVAEVLPENGKLKETALLIEHVTKATAYDAKLTQDFIHKVSCYKRFQLPLIAQSSKKLEEQNLKTCMHLLNKCNLFFSFSR